jgi:DNA-binding HxlR family transcriptional regulator
VPEADARSADEAAPLEAAAATVGDRWTLLVVDALRAGPLRFADLTARLPGVAPNVLTRRLRDLEAAGLVRAERYSERPRRHRYALTALGSGLGPALAALAHWGEQLLDARPSVDARASVDAGPSVDGAALAANAIDGDEDEIRYA